MLVDFESQAYTYTHLTCAKNRVQGCIACANTHTHSVTHLHMLGQMHSLLAPAKLESKSYDELVQAMAGHHNPPPSEIVQRYKFNIRNRLEGESVAKYISELRGLSEFCNYGNSLNDMLRDRLVCGVADQAIQRKLLAESNLTLEKATNIALAMETAVRNAETLRSPVGKGSDSGLGRSSESLHKVHKTPPGAILKGKTRRLMGSATEGISCYRCGQKSDKANLCPHKETTCHYCHKVGHLKKVCRKLKQVEKAAGPSLVKQVEVTSQEPPESEYPLFQIGKSRSTPITVEVLLDGHPHIMEIDTGAAVSVISQCSYQQLFGRRPVESTTVRLTLYRGTPLPVLGKSTVLVRHGGAEAKLPLIVVEGNGPSLLGRNWLEQLRLDWQAVHKLYESALDQVLQKHQEVFNPGLGTLQGYEAKIHMDANAQPRFHKARSVPYSMKVLVEKELDRLEEEGIIEPVTFSDWAAPIVPVLKADKSSVRICGDFKLTVNQASKLDHYPIPKVEDLFASLAGGQTFTKLDLSQAYQQIRLEEQSRQYVVINTHKGLFRYTRLPYGVSSAPAIFQRTMELLLQGIPGVVVYLDDILITGKTKSEHVKALDEVLSRLEKAGLRLQKRKCVFMATEVDYLGHRIDAEGLHPLADKVWAVQEAPSPRSVSELKSYLGLLSYYGKFLPSLSSILAPLYRLLKVSVRWQWSDKEQKAFDKSKELLLSSKVLVHFDPDREVVLACDASPYGLGAVLSHRMPDGVERPIAFASRTLSPAEQKYSQLEKEGLACVFGVKKFHTYLYGRQFSLLTDHKPLLGLFSEHLSVPVQASARIQRWALTLSMYEYVLGFRRGAAHHNADALSRLPLPDSPVSVPDPP